MDDDIVQELLDWQHIIDRVQGKAVVMMLSGTVFGDAADEIERLRAERDDLQVLLRGRTTEFLAEIERLRAALAIAAGMISTLPPYEDQHPEAVMEMLLEEARRG